VAILAQDGVEHLDLFHACSKLGAIHTALNWRLHWRELAGIVANTTPRVLVYSDKFKDAVAEIVQAAAGAGHAIAHLVHLDGDGLPGSVRYDDLLAASPDTPVAYDALEAEDIACLLFTGGTTGLPKGAQISHRQVCWNVLNTVIHDVQHDDIYLNVFPLFHIGGLFTYLSSQVVFGNTTILVKQFDPAQVLDLIERERVTIFRRGAHHVPDDDAGAQLGQRRPHFAALLHQRRRAPARAPGGAVHAGEGYPLQAGLRHDRIRPRSLCPAAGGRHPQGGQHRPPQLFRGCARGGRGEPSAGAAPTRRAGAQGPSGCSGYWNDPAASAAVLDAEGWFHTGDIVEYDEAWYFYVRDRKKDMFISGGENVYPVEIEQVLYKHPAVLMCAVVGVPDAKWGEVGLACVVLRPGQSASAAELFNLLRQHLAPYKVPKRIEYLDALPLSGMGKVLKRELRERFAVQSDGGLTA
jgi:fatty-acyl-CoA synthase